jgi:hypothetical protein
MLKIVESISRTACQAQLSLFDRGPLLIPQRCTGARRSSGRDAGHQMFARSSRLGLARRSAMPATLPPLDGDTSDRAWRNVKAILAADGRGRNFDGKGETRIESPRGA